MLDKERDERKAERAKQKQDNSAWSEKAGKREARDKRKDKQSKKKKWLKAQQVPGPVTEDSDLKRSRQDNEEDDWAELAREERMAKKVRRGDVTEMAFNAEFGKVDT